jgi:hypothetical protein
MHKGPKTTIRFVLNAGILHASTENRDPPSPAGEEQPPTEAGGARGARVRRRRRVFIGAALFVACFQNSVSSLLRATCASMIEFQVSLLVLKFVRRRCS